MRRFLIATPPAAVAVYLALLAGQWLDLSDHWVFSWPGEAGAAGLVLLAAWALGRRILGWLELSVVVPLPGHVAMACGLALLTGVVLAFGLVGLLERWLIWVLVIPLAGMGVVDLVQQWRRWGRRVELPHLSLSVSLGLAPSLMVLLVVFLFASLPPAFYDAMTYHLALPNLYLMSGSLVQPEGFSLAAYPQNAEMLSVIAMGLSGEKAAQILGGLLAFAAVWAVWDLARSRWGTASANLATLFLVTGWFFWFEAAFSKNDLLGGYYLLIAVVMALSWTEKAPRRAVILSGVLAGVAAGVKFSNLLGMILCVIVVCAVGIGSSWQGRARRGALWLVLALVVASPWMIRNSVNHSNPLFPAFTSIFGGQDWSEQSAERMRLATGGVLDPAPIAILERWIGIGWDHARYGSGGEVSPLLLPLLLAGLVAARRREEKMLMGLAASMMLLGVGFFSSYLRIYAFALLVAPLGAAVLLARWRHPAWRIVFASLVVLAAGFQVVGSLQRARRVSDDGLRVVAGEVSQEQYLQSLLNYVAMARWIDRELPPGAKILMVGSARTAYLRRPCHANYAWDEQWIRRVLEADADHDTLRGSLAESGFTHVLLNANDFRRLEVEGQRFGVSGDAARRDRLNEFFAGMERLHVAEECFLFQLASRPESAD